MSKMKPLSVKISVIILLSTATVSYGQNTKWTVDAGADLVSSYVWRGMYQAGGSIQPALSLSACGLTLGSWGSTDFSSSTKELDFFLSYEKGGFSASVSDYWWKGEGTSFFKERNSHILEAGLSFAFSEKFPLSLGVSTMFWGDEDKKENGKQQYSTYIAASYSFTINEVDCEAGIGISPWSGMYGKDVNMAAVTAKATKKLQLSAKYALPVFVELILSPAKDNAHLVFGIKF
jgi:hypothetical protein